MPLTGTGPSERARPSARDRKSDRRKLARRHPQPFELARHLIGRIEHDGRLRERVEQQFGHLRVDRVALARELQPLRVDADDRHDDRRRHQRDRHAQTPHRRAVEAPRLRGEFELAQVEAARERVARELPRTASGLRALERRPRGRRRRGSSPGTSASEYSAPGRSPASAVERRHDGVGGKREAFAERRALAARNRDLDERRTTGVERASGSTAPRLRRSAPAQSTRPRRARPR